MGKATTVAVIGASGGVGREVVRTALDNGLRVRALARSRTRTQEKIGDLEKLDEFVEGNVDDPESLARLLEGSVDIVLSCLGTPKGAAPCVENGTRKIIDAMRAAGVCRYVVEFLSPSLPLHPTPLVAGDAADGRQFSLFIERPWWHGGIQRMAMISSIGVGDSLPQGLAMAPFFARCIKPLFLKKLFADLDAAEEVCWRAAGMRCVCVRPPGLTNKRGTGIFRLAPSCELKPSKRASIPREDVAAAMIKFAKDDSAFLHWEGKGVTVVS